MSRRWLLVLPVALVLAGLTSASRLQMFWWPDELHDRTTGRQGEPVRLRDQWVDEAGDEHHRELTVTLVDVRPATTVEGFSGPERLDPPTGTAVWEVRLRLDVGEDVPLGGCHVSVLDDEGHEADAVGGSVGGVQVPTTACEPEGRTGPGYDGSPPDGDAPRPASYEVSAYAVTAASMVPDRVRLWWEAPDVAELSLGSR
ncbi:hypothetical protein [Nocardioides sp. SYSU D00038]|uniref:hypothetical protein n=1 Tax=Nocardioides sp. SYSU D00038 TaxID=2812554 RepID=UPI001967A7DF|nr:hypothetical protein [Nocardioides sp. SYSU D00038]